MTHGSTPRWTGGPPGFRRAGCARIDVRPARSPDWPRRSTYGPRRSCIRLLRSSSSSTVTGRVAPPTNDDRRHCSGSPGAGRLPGQDPVRLPLHEDPLEFGRRRTTVSCRPRLLDVGEPPRPLAGIAARRRLLDEPVLRQLAQVEGAVRLAGTEPTGAGGGGESADRAEQLDQIEPQRVGHRPHGFRVGDAHKAKDSFGNGRMSNTSLEFRTLVSPPKAHGAVKIARCRGLANCTRPCGKGPQDGTGGPSSLGWTGGSDDHGKVIHRLVVRHE